VREIFVLGWAGHYVCVLEPVGDSVAVLGSVDWCFIGMTIMEPQPTGVD